MTAGVVGQQDFISLAPSFLEFGGGSLLYEESMATFKLSLNVFVQEHRSRWTRESCRVPKIGMETRSWWADLIEQSPSIPRAEGRLSSR